jgi:hypothetical protein
MRRNGILSHFEKSCRCLAVSELMSYVIATTLMVDGDYLTL